MILGTQGWEGHVCTLLNLMLAPVVASCPEGHPLSVLLRGMKTFLCSFTCLSLCWRFSLSPEEKQACTLAALSCSQFEFNMKRMLKWKPDCLQGEHSRRDVPQNSGQWCLKTLKLTMGQSPRCMLSQTIL